MPYKVRKLPNQDLYKVYNADTGRVYSHHTTKRNANKQLRLLQMTGGGGNTFSRLSLTPHDDEEDLNAEERERQDYQTALQSQRNEAVLRDIPEQAERARNIRNWNENQREEREWLDEKRRIQREQQEEERRTGRPREEAFDARIYNPDTMWVDEWEADTTRRRRGKRIPEAKVESEDTFFENQKQQVLKEAKKLIASILNVFRQELQRDDTLTSEDRQQILDEVMRPFITMLRTLEKQKRVPISRYREIAEYISSKVENATLLLQARMRQKKEPTKKEIKKDRDMTGGGGVFSFLDTVNDDEARQRAFQQEMQRREDVAREEREEKEARREAKRARAREREIRRQEREQEREQEIARLEAREAYRAELRAKAEEEHQKRRDATIRYIKELEAKREADKRR